MVEPYDPVLIKSDSGAPASSSSSSAGYPAPYYGAQLGLRFKMQPHLFPSSDQLELTCVSRVGLRVGGDALVEGRARWIIRQPDPGSPSAGIRRQVAAQTAVDDNNWTDERDDGDVEYDDEEGGDAAGREETFGGDSDGTAQSISENPSRRTQPVVGSHPGIYR